LIELQLSQFSERALSYQYKNRIVDQLQLRALSYKYKNHIVAQLTQGPELLVQKSYSALSVMTQLTQGPELLVRKII